MKAYLALISTVALALAACSQEQAAAPAADSENVPAASEAVSSEPAAQPASEQPASESAAVSCETTVESDDAMKYDTSEIVVGKECKEFKITLKHVGKMPVAAMGHNIVISKAEDAQGVFTDGAAATAANNYIKEGDSRVLAATKLIGGGEETSLTLDVSKLAADGNYEFFCTFPGHYGLMKGTLKLGA
ncbi:MAG: azurin [Neisseria sp.]|nr:azurin [Neisseria sp.]